MLVSKTSYSQSYNPKVQVKVEAIFVKVRYILVYFPYDALQTISTCINFRF